jgi:16S rRNA (adenine1518-N6/adenine1519-N6)-dimethyltransferase
MGNRAKALGITPRKSLGQNFLNDDALCARIAAAAGVAPGECVFEIGPGLGALTRHLADCAPDSEIIAIELDQTLIPLLHEELGTRANVRVIHADALETDYRALAAGRPVRFVSNLPYYISGHAIRTLLDAGVDWRSIVLTLQLEVVQRIVAHPPQMSLLAVSVQYYGVPEFLFRIPAAAFYPQPNVDSATLRILPRQNTGINTEHFFRVVRAGFLQPRKQLRNTIAAGLGISKGSTEDILTKSGITPNRRAETLSLSEWIQIANTINF